MPVTKTSLNEITVRYRNKGTHEEPKDWVFEELHVSWNESGPGLL